MNRADLQQLAHDRILDARALLDAGRWSGAYYLCGYAVECAFKACIAKQTQLHDFPDKAAVTKFYTHNLAELLNVSGVRGQFDLDAPPGTNHPLRIHWDHVREWNESTRYEQVPEFEARRLYEAVTDDQNGVLPWLKARW